MTEAFVGIGSNIRPRAHVRQALAELEARFGQLGVSPAYRGPAVGFNGADFINLVVGFATALNVYALLDELGAIEAACGRQRGATRAAPRTMDLDLLLYGDAVIDSHALVLPRPDICEYAFVLRPLAELAPNYRHPLRGTTFAELWAGFDAVGQPLRPISLAF